MNISFNGIKEINNYAKQYGPLNNAEKDLCNKAIDYAKIDAVRSGDGDYFDQCDTQKANDFLLALHSFKFKPSAFAYKVAVDAMSSDASMVQGMKEQISELARDIAYITPEITKEDIYDDWNILKRRSY